MTFVPLKLCQEIRLWCDPSLMIMRRPLKRHRVAWYLDDAVNRMAWYLDMRRHSKLPAPAPNAADPAGNYWSYYKVTTLAGRHCVWGLGRRVWKAHCRRHREMG